MLIRARITHTEFVARATHTHTHSSCDTQPPNYTCKAHAKLWLLSLASKFLFPSVSSSLFFVPSPLSDTRPCRCVRLLAIQFQLCQQTIWSSSQFANLNRTLSTMQNTQSVLLSGCHFAQDHTHTQRTWVAKCVSQTSSSRHAIMTHVNFWRCAPVINRFLSYAATLVMLLHVC